MAPPSAVIGFSLPLPIRMLNRAGAALDRLGLAPVSLSEEALLREACRRTNLSDWGDETFRTALNVLLDSCEREAGLSLLGRVAVRRECVRLLCNRLLIQDALKRHPEVLEQPIPRPLVITGLPRTGTTLLHNLLAQDPVVRVPLAWELRQPAPRLPRDARTIDPRIREAEQAMHRLLRVAPPLRLHHPYDPHGPEECNLLLMNTFQCFLFCLLCEVPGYLAWLLQQDWTETYRYYRLQLQLLQQQRPGRPWVLKCPAHLLCLDALLRVFPDACLIQTHRDPRKVVASFASMAAAVRCITSEAAPDAKHLGEDSLATLALSIDRAMQVREQTGPEHFFDIQYRHLTADPVGTVRQIYDYFGYAFTPALEHGMRQWLREHPPHKHGVHRYSLEAFSLDPETVDRQFEVYTRRFGVQLERLI